MTKRIIAAMMAVSLCAAAATQAAINATGDVNPPDPATWTDSTIGRIGDTGAGSVTVDGGSDLLSYGVAFAYEVGSTGVMTVDGYGSTWTSAAGFTIGRYGHGTLDITAGGGVSGNGTIGYFGTGVVTVAGPGSTWTSSGLDVGGFGDGTLDITGGGAVSSGLCDIGDWSGGATGVVTVSGAGSRLTTDSRLYVGRGGDGTLNITDGGYVLTGEPGYSPGAYIADGPYATGAATVAGAESTWDIYGDLYVGDSGDAVLNITDSGLVEVRGGTFVAIGAGSTGAINFDNGTLTTREFLCASDSLSGTGTINTKGIVSDVDLVFDATHGMTQSFTINGPGQNITVNLDVDGYRQMGAGYGGEGTMRIADGVALQSSDGFLGYKSGSTGTVTVAGAGSAWTISDDLYVGGDGSGTLHVAAGGAVTSSYASIGRNAGSTGAATVTGTGSTWTSSRFLYVGDGGDGTLNIADSGLVAVTGSTYVAKEAGSAGAINFDNGTLTTDELLSASDDLSGTGTINTHGLVTDVNLVFDATHGLTQVLTLNDPGQSITINLDVDGSGAMGAGNGGSGSMHIADGVAMQSSEGYLGYRSGSTGVATVNGEGSEWTISDELYVGSSGSGTLDVTAGGVVTVNTSYIGYGAGSAGVVTVSGAGSTWENTAQDFSPLSGRLGVGHNGSGTLNISAGGTVISSYGFIATAVFGVPDPSSCSTGVARVSGEDSIWTIWRGLTIGRDGSGALNIDDGGLVSVGRGWAESLAIDGNDDFINMTSGGMLAVYGQADDSLATFLTDLVEGVDENLRYWDGSSWESLTAATPGVDYSLAFYDAGDLAGYTVLTVVPEPATLSLLALAGAAVLWNRRK